MKINIRAAMPVIKLMNPLSDPIPKKKNIPPQKQLKIKSSITNYIHHLIEETLRGYIKDIPTIRI